MQSLNVAFMSKLAFLRVSALTFSLFVCGIAIAKNDNIKPSGSLVETKQGKLQGAEEKGVSVWRGINYAKPPVGELRFRAPQAPDTWEGVKVATEFGPIAPQMSSSLTDKDAKQSENCLSLNIWSPAADGKKRPVMFWIHGGGFVLGTGSAELYNGAYMAKNGDVVVVTINYRLGPLGFLYFKDTKNKQFENNLGIRDQIAALKWVRENIAAFGGDPEQVTIFGESAGGTSVETLLSTPSAKGMFTKAIIQSGPPAIVWTPAIAESVTAKYLSLLHISPDSMHLLKTVPLDTLKAAEDALLDYMVKETNQKVFAPSIDGEVLTNDIFKCMKPTIGGNVPVMIGTNLNEATMFASKKWGMAPRTSAGLEKYFDEVTDEKSKKQVLASYPHYPKTSGVIEVLTDAIFRIPAVRLAECRSTYAPVYMYSFEWASPVLKMAKVGSFHGLELPFVFHCTEGKTGKLLKLICMRSTIKRLSGEMQQSWINFARYGNPNGTGEQKWKPYTAEERNTMIFNRKSKAVVDPYGQQRQAWEGVVYY